MSLTVLPLYIRVYFFGSNLFSTHNLSLAISQIIFDLDHIIYFIYSFFPPSITPRHIAAKDRKPQKSVGGCLVKQGVALPCCTAPWAVLHWGRTAVSAGYSWSLKSPEQGHVCKTRGMCTCTCVCAGSLKGGKTTFNRDCPWGANWEARGEGGKKILVVTLKFF